MFEFKAFPVIKTPRLILRAFRPSDVGAIFAIRSDYEVTKYNSGEAYTSEHQAAELIESTLLRYVEKKSIYWAITLNDSNEDFVIGQIGYNSWDQTDHRAEIGFDLNRKYWKKGIMNEAITAVITFGFIEMNLNRIEAQVSTYNASSKRLLVKVSFLHEGTQREQYFERGAYHDLDIFALLKRDWDIEKQFLKIEYDGAESL
mmetsp:Transcript_21790/g.36445  ORF Transcript_21790/g.36445 Transcript_21790/m.36445 type:complete len:202 (-) Transcript_21790:2991-3596(-)